jgi:hypothetical protein
MNKEEVLAMKAGKELNIMVAEDLMGCKVTQDEFIGDLQRGSNDVWEPLQAFSEDHSIAEQVLDKLKHDYSTRIEFNDGTEHWEAEFKDLETGLSYGTVSSPDAAEAICKAALLVIAGEDSSIMEKRSRQELTKSIIEIELDMFEHVRTNEPSLCKDRPETFKTMRRITHYSLSKETLESYLEDLQRAKAAGRNLLTEKYARMDNKIPPLKTNPTIKNIVKIEERWMKELSEKYPHAFKDESGFKVYLSSELETYSDNTLGLYFGDVSRAEEEGRNLAEERYNMLFQQIGYGSIAEVESKAGSK